MTLKPQLSDDDYADKALEHALGLMDANLAAYWTPNADFFNRLTKKQLGAIGKQVISEQFEQAHLKDKKALFAEALWVTFNTSQADSGLAKDVHQRIDAWLPDGMSVRSALLSES